MHQMVQQLSSREKSQKTSLRDSHINSLRLPDKLSSTTAKFSQQLQRMSEAVTVFNCDSSVDLREAMPSVLLRLVQPQL